MTGLYLHVPFCRLRCPYCDFNVLTGADAELRRRYARALETELARVAAAGPRAVAPPGSGDSEWPVFGSLFVGGGTPTQLDAADLAAVLRRAAEVLPLAADVEVTVEANPEDVTAAALEPLVEAGLDRISIGAQAFAPGVLAFLDRRHDPVAPLRAVEVARQAGVAVVSLDLIYGTPTEQAEDWRAALDAAVETGADHLSCYALTLERNTPYARRVSAGEQPAPDDDVEAERMAAAEERLGAAGYRRYEISNWARPGAQCRHNLGYWRGGDYLGVGAGAHGHWAGRRWWSIRSTLRWLQRVEAGAAPTGGEEVVDADARRTERLLLGLRLAEGVERRLVEPLDDAAVADLVGHGLLVDRGGRLALTGSGRPLADAVALRLA